ncbi:hypothetical protein D3C79_948230 [compost metagenome]
MLDDRHEGALTITAITIEEEQQLLVGATRYPVAHTALQEGGQLGISTGDFTDELLPAWTSSPRDIDSRTGTGQQMGSTSSKETSTVQIDNPVTNTE